jgi:hypothetical protein
MRSTTKAVSERQTPRAQLRQHDGRVVAPLGAVVWLGAAASFGGLVGKVVSNVQPSSRNSQTLSETNEGSSEKVPGPHELVSRLRH